MIVGNVSMWVALALNYLMTVVQPRLLLPKKHVLIYVSELKQQLFPETNFLSQLPKKQKLAEMTLIEPTNHYNDR